MKYQTTTIYLLIIFLSITVFGFLGMSIMEHGMHGVCPFSPAGSLLCPEEGEIAAALHHVNSLEGFFEATFNISFLSLLLFIFFVAAFYMYKALEFRQKETELGLFARKYKELHEDIFTPLIPELNWLKSRQKTEPEKLFNTVYSLMPL